MLAKLDDFGWLNRGLLLAAGSLFVAAVVVSQVAAWGKARGFGADYPLRILLPPPQPIFAASRSSSMLSGYSLDPHPADERANDPLLSLAEENADTATSEAGALASRVQGPAAEQEIPRFRLAGRYDFMEVDFQLSDVTPDRGNIRLTKSVLAEEVVLGELAISIDGASRIFVERQSLEGVFPQLELRPSSSEDGHIALHELRAQGLDLRYDPVRDLFFVNAG